MNYKRCKGLKRRLVINRMTSVASMQAPARDSRQRRVDQRVSGLPSDWKGSFDAATSYNAHAPMFPIGLQDAV
jgi:hypothetical protein